VDEGYREHLDAAYTDFDAVHLQIGDRVQVEILEARDNIKYFTTLIGYLKGASILVKTPVVNGLSLPMAVGDTVRVRMFSGVNVYTFNATVERVCLAPFAYVHLSFPTAIRAAEIRNAPRLRVDMPAMVLQINDAGGKEPIPVMISNLSVSGALIDSGQRFGEVGDTVTLAFTTHIQPNDYEVKLKLKAVIHSVSKQHRADFAGREFFEYGVEFQSLQPPRAVLLHNFICQILMENHHKIV